ADLEHPAARPAPDREHADIERTHRALLSVISGITKLQPITRAPSLLTPPDRRAGGYSRAASPVTPGRSPLGRTELRPVSAVRSLRQQRAGVRRYSRCLRRAELGGFMGRTARE